MSFLRVLLALLLAVATATCRTEGAPVTNGITTIDQAYAFPEPEDRPSPEHWTRLTLRHSWNTTYPGRSGHAIYRLSLPPGDGSPKAVHFPRVGNQAVIRLNGGVVQRIGELGQPRFDGSKTNWLVVLPAALLATDRANQLEVEITVQSGRYGGLWPVEYGDVGTLTVRYNELQRWHGLASIWLGAGWLLMGLAALGLWAQQKDPLYGWFASAALLGTIRHLDRLWLDVPVPWPHWGGIVAIGYGLHLILMMRVIQGMLEQERQWLERLMRATVVFIVFVAVLAFEGNQPLAWTIGLVGLFPYGIIVIGLAVRAVRQRGRALSWAVLATGLIALACALHDVGWVRIGAPSRNTINISVMPLATFAVALVMGTLIVMRYNATVLAYKQLNEELAQRVADRESELARAFDHLREQQREQAVLQERQRIMREIHDGIGAQLVGLLNLAHKGLSDPALIEEHVKFALDEMRIAVDSLQPVHGDLATVLATLRYRLQPRLEAAGIEVAWDVPALPALRDLTPQAVLQVQRILLEGLTNILKHAKARTVRLSARLEDGATPVVVLDLVDDGAGLAPVPEHVTRGHGLANMAARAASIGARLDIGPEQPKGYRVRLTWPVRIANA